MGKRLSGIFKTEYSVRIKIIQKSRLQRIICKRLFFVVFSLFVISVITMVCFFTCLAISVGTTNAGNSFFSFSYNIPDSVSKHNYNDTNGKKIFHKNPPFQTGCLFLKIFFCSCLFFCLLRMINPITRAAITMIANNPGINPTPNVPLVNKVPN